MRGLPPEAQEKSNILWLHAFDFQRWFQTQIIFFIYQNYSPRYDRDIISIFTTYMARSLEKKDLIYVPYMLQKYIEGFPDPYVEQELSQDSLPMLVQHTCKVLDRENKAINEYF